MELKYSPGRSEDRNKGTTVLEADPRTAGSITLLIQVALPILLLRYLFKTSNESHPCYSLRLGGGTNVSFAPPIEHVQYVLLPILRRMTCSSGLRVDVDRYGYFPRGGGAVKLDIAPATCLQTFNHMRKEGTNRGSCEVNLIFNSQCSPSMCNTAFSEMEEMCRQAFRNEKDIKEITVTRVMGKQVAANEGEAARGREKARVVEAVAV